MKLSDSVILVLCVWTIACLGWYADAFVTSPRKQHFLRSSLSMAKPQRLDENVDLRERSGKLEEWLILLQLPLPLSNPVYCIAVLMTVH